jgi:hypothetical protein
MAYDTTNRGAIWKNDDKQNDNHPDFKGSINVDGKDYWISAWKRKEGAAAKAPALSFSVKPKDEQPRREPAASISERAQAAMKRPAGASDRDLDDSIPF